MKIHFLLLAGLISCTDKGDDADSAEPSADSGDTTPDTTPADTAEDSGEPIEEPIQATASGTVTVQLYIDGDDGEREYISWADAYDGSYPFGSIFLTTYSEDDSGNIDYHGSTAVSYDQVDAENGNAYEITINRSSSGDVNLYAAVDYWRDGIISTGEPVGVYPTALEVVDGGTFEGVDLTVLIPYYDFTSGGGGGGSGCSAVTVSGEVTIDKPYSGGSVLAMLLDSAGGGPYDWGWATVEGDEDGAGGTYAFSTCENFGTYHLRGAWDSNGNSLIDPADTWGSYVNEDNIDANPVTIGTTDLPDYDLLVPLGSSGLSVIPFTRLSGTLTVGDGTFDDLPSGTSAVYVVALKYRPTEGTSVSTLYEQAYDIEVFEPKEFSGQSSLDWSLGVPTGSVVYLWAYVDSDNDGLVNESGEYVASGGEDDNGKITVTAQSGSENHDLTMGLASH